MLCTYDPQIFSGDFPTTEPHTLVERSTVLFEYPYDTPTLTLELKTPVFNDQEAIDLSRIQRRSIGGSLIVYRDDDWPKGFSLNYSFENLSLQNKDDIMNFVKQTLGKEIKFTDHVSKVYKVIITNPKDFISDELNTCGFTWKVNLQGIL